MKDSNERWTHIDSVSDLSLAQKFVLVMLGRYSSASNGYECWYSITTLAERMCTTRKTVIAAIKVLEDRKLISVKRVRSGAARNKPNIYVLNIDEIIKQSKGSPDSNAQGSVPTTPPNGEGSVPTTPPNGEGSVVGIPPDSKNLSTCSVTGIPPNGEGSVATIPPASESSLGGSVVGIPRWCSSDTKVVSQLHQGSVVATPEYDLNKILSKKLIRTGGASELLPDGEEIFNCTNSDLMNFWTYIKGFVKRTTKRTLPSKPSQQDLDSMLWAVGEFSVDPQAKEDCISMCKFVIDELGEPEAVLNPLVRLQMAANEHPDGVTRFYDRYMGFDE
ncbi:TPA: helix-turn-helix domain-containing protein [Vibrio parahaemolyticus]